MSLPAHVLERLVDREYRVVDRAAVTRFLRRNPDLAPCLIGLRNRVRGLFGTDPVVLAMSDEPSGSEEAQLLALIETLRAPESALRLLDQLDESWSTSLSPEFASRLCVDVRHG